MEKMKKNDVLTLTAGEISHLLMLRPKRFSKGMVSGAKIHRDLGYNQSRIFARYYNHKAGKAGNWILVVGKPDRIKEGRVEELKTFLGEFQRQVQEKVGFLQVQLYCWLTGLPKGFLYLYDIEKEKLVKQVICSADTVFVKKALDKAIEIKQQIDSLDQLVVQRIYQ